jgi:anti-anti-sigma factor
MSSGVPPFWVSIDVRRARVTVAGDLDRTHAHHLLDALRTLAATGHRSWSVDTEQVTFCDTGGLRALIAGLALARNHHSDLTLGPTSRCVQRLVDLGGPDRLLSCLAPRQAPHAQPPECPPRALVLDAVSA